MQVAANFFTKRSGSLSLYKIFGKISASTTCSAKSIVWRAILAKHEQTYLFNWASLCGISEDKKGTAPASTTCWANSCECLQISLKALAEILFKAVSGSWIQSTNKGMAPTSTTAYAKSLVCFAM